MIKILSAYIVYSIISFFTTNSYATPNSPSIVDNKEVSICIEKYGDNNSECLGALSELTEKNLNTLYQEKLNEISHYDYRQWWMGEKKQREEMRVAFIHSQKLWLAYRQDYCKAASTGAEGIEGYGAILLSCLVNMGIRRIDEIRMIHPDLSDG
ncbi:lysozyme inhibitor LprI family protein [Rosenbergiella epipactidis]|uniref:lysozyme inhibitor LprI family protein n=1 Tax=Rosenbergiella epipactidis TaxID=1544694 RepID=UPI001F4DAF81|nr:lysozyme inhibitor LprI family protein [Rosenbergiella epipactidis]